MRRIHKGVFFLSLFFVLALGSCRPVGKSSVFADSGAKKGLRVLTIGTADSGGTMYPAGKAIAQAVSSYDPTIKMNISASNGSVSNVNSLMNGEIDLGLVSGDVAFSAVNGINTFSGQPQTKLKVIAAVYPSLSNWIALASSDLIYVHDLKGKHIGIGPQDSTTDQSAVLALKTMGISEYNSVLINCGLGSGAQDVKEERIDAVYGFAGVPINSFTELADSVPCRVLQYTDQELRSIIRTNPFYYAEVIPAGTYNGQEEDVSTFGIKCLLCVSEDMDEDLVYELTSILYEQASELKELHSALAAMDKTGFMCGSLPIELHNGARRFYEEHGLLDFDY